MNFYQCEYPHHVLKSPHPVPAYPAYPAYRQAGGRQAHTSDTPLPRERGRGEGLKQDLKSFIHFAISILGLFTDTHILPSLNLSKEWILKI